MVHNGIRRVQKCLKACQMRKSLIERFAFNVQISHFCHARQTDGQWLGRLIGWTNMTGHIDPYAAYRDQKLQVLISCQVITVKFKCLVFILVQTWRVRPEPFWAELVSGVGQNGLQLGLCLHLSVDAAFPSSLLWPQPCLPAHTRHR